MRAFTSAQFIYCPLVWMFHSRTLTSRINRLHERSLRIVYGDYISSFDELLLSDNSLSIHYWNIHALVIESFKVKNDLKSEIMREVFPNASGSYDLKNNYEFQCSNLETAHYGTESLWFLVPKIWNLIPEEIKNETSLNGFKKKLRSWVPEKCPCRICKI